MISKKTAIILFLLIFLFFIVCVCNAKSNDTIDRLNKQNQQIQTMSCEVYNSGSKSEGGPVARSSGQLYFQKPTYFRMIAYGEKVDKRLMLDLGSTEDIFWFFARRMKPATLKFARYADLDRTNLDGALHPIWMMELLGLNNIDLTDAKIVESAKQLSVYYIRRAPNGAKNTKVVLINKKSLVVAGHLIYGERDELISQAIVTSITPISSMNIPEQINISWNKKDIDITINFKNIKLNKKIDPSLWVIPKIKPMENLAK
jgi:outer membrane lipoprotein-sorting protein